MKGPLELCLQEYVPVINEFLRGLQFTDTLGGRLAAPLAEAMHYSVDAGGKRLRPVLTIMAYRLLAEDWQRALPVAAAYELVHTYSLIHDDLPAMDDDDLRRGRPTNHKVYGEAMAVLAGDALLTEAFRLLAEDVEAGATTRIKLISGLARAAGRDGMVGGQAIDILSQGKNLHAMSAQQGELLEVLHRRKTGAMISGALLAGVDLAGGNASLRERLAEFGSVIGLAFQVADDILDEVGDEALLGKEIGSDRDLGKLTFVSLFGLEKARQKLVELHRQALGLLEPLEEKGEPLKALADYIVERDR
ncbi:MAG: polyprenyl synthetase family protein [Deltaproteobacteria bacterium]|nr:polyprenyl synthetase family protein [Deltaproteobacteria bacterium]